MFVRRTRPLSLLSSALTAALTVIVGAAGVGLPSVALAAEPAAAPAELAPPPLTLTVDAATDAGPWRLRVENTGDLPVRLAADPRLLSLEITPPAGTFPPPKKGQKAPGPIRCALPADARPSSDEGSDLVIPGKRAWSARFDPFFYCFSARERAALVKDAVVTAHFGFTPPAPKPKKKPLPPTPPFVASPVGAAVTQLAPVKILDAAPMTLGTTPQAISKVEAEKKADDASLKKPLLVTMPASLDVSRGVDLPTSVTIQNDSDRKTTLFFRPNTVGFNVNGPAGAVRCGTTRDVSSPIRELFTTLAPKGKSSASLLLGAVCPADTFDAPGIYRVTPRIDTTGASGRSIGMSTWDNVAEGTTPMLLRVRSPRRPPEEPTRPTLE